MFRQRGEEYVDPSQAKIEEAIQKKIRDKAERHYKNRETKEVNGSKLLRKLFFISFCLNFLCIF